MAYSKSDFFQWDDEDINLDDILGDYTCSSDEIENVEPEKKGVKVTNVGQYECTECTKLYKSISGIRGHMISKHGYTKVNVSEFHKASKTSTENETNRINKATTSPFEINKDEFTSMFNATVQESLRNVKENKFRNLSFSIHGKGIIELAEKLSENSEMLTKVSEFLCQRYHTIFSSAKKEMNTKEAIFTSFYEMRVASVDEVAEILATIGDGFRSLRQFVSTLLHQILEDLISKRSLMYKRPATETPSAQISTNEQAILYYVSGFLIYSVSKQIKVSKHTEKQAMEAAVENMQKNTAVTSITGQFSKWTEKLNRGGLKIPNEDTFLLVREFESICRQNENDTSTSDVYSTEILKQKIIESFMIKYYAEKLMPGKYCMKVLEKILSKFLTMRGNACARKRKLQLLKKSSNSKALRKGLKEKTNV